MDGLLLALQFMTRIPVKKQLEFSEKNIKTAIAFFPLIGLVIGTAAGLAYLGLRSYSGNTAAIAALFVVVILTGGLHLDGLSDTLDGFLSNRDKERTLEIMRDSRIGSFGVIGLILVLLAKFVFMSELGLEEWIGIPVAMINSRFAASIMISRFPSARSEGLGSLFRRSRPGKAVLIALAGYSIFLLLFRPQALVAAAGAIISGYLLGGWSMKKIGGLTGDVYGAGIEISEMVSMAIYWGVIQWI